MQIRNSEIQTGGTSPGVFVDSRNTYLPHRNSFVRGLLLYPFVLYPTVAHSFAAFWHSRLIRCSRHPLLFLIYSVGLLPPFLLLDSYLDIPRPAHVSGNQIARKEAIPSSAPWSFSATWRPWHLVGSRPPSTRVRCVTCGFVCTAV